MSRLTHISLVTSALITLSVSSLLAQGTGGLIGTPIEERTPVEEHVSSEEHVSVEERAPLPAPVPFGPGEEATYQVRVGLFGGVGNGTMEVVDVEDVRDHPTYNLRLTIKGGVPFFRVDTRFESWLDIEKLASRRFEQDQKEGRYKRHRIFEIYPEEGRWERLDSEEEGELLTDLPLDDVSFLYFARTLPLEVGETYTFPRYFKEESNPVILKVLRKETVTVPVGTFETIVVQPIIKTSGLFGDGGKAEVYFTDDDQRILVQMKSRVPILRSLNLVLESYVPGKQVAGADGGGVVSAQRARSGS